MVVFCVDSLFSGDGDRERTSKVTTIFHSLLDGGNKGSNKRVRGSLALFLGGAPFCFFLLLRMEGSMCKGAMVVES